MSDPLSTRYDAVPYRHGAIPDSHPARLAAIGRLHGVPTIAPDHCRVLELGCGEGLNLLPLAERFPHSEFVGVDFSPAEIALGEAARNQCNLQNARLECADLRSFEPEPGGFDYIIAHGVYSWAPDEVKQRLLAICSRALSLGGVAYLSYNTLPGWGLLSGLRAFLLEEVAASGDAAAQIEHARTALAAIGQALAAQPGGYSALVRESVADMLQKPPALFFHDDLAPVNDPCTFTSFVARAAAHDLHYLAEAHYATMHFEHVPAPMRAALEALNLDFLRSQQYLDVLFQRWLRNSLLCRAAPAPDRAIDFTAIRDCALGLRLRATESGVNLRPGATLRLASANDLSLEFTDPAEKAFLAALAQAAPVRLPFPRALALANQYLERVSLPLIANDAPLCALLYRLFKLDALDLLLVGEGAWLETGAPPMPSPLMRFEAARGLTVTNRWHEPITLTPEGQRWLANPSNDPNPAARHAGLLV